MAWNGLTILGALAEGAMLTRQIAAVLGRPSRDVTGCLGSLRVRGFIASVHGIHRITEAGRKALASGTEITSGPCNGATTTRNARTLRVRAWRLMRMRDGFSLDDLLSTLCDGSEADAACNLGTYIQALEAAGYLLPLPRRGDGAPRRWRLRRDRDTGPEAPAWNKAVRVLRDHNTGETFHLPAHRSRKGSRHAA